MWSEYRLRVPGRFASGVAFLDLETEKVPTDGFVMKNGEPLRRRWSAYMAGVGVNGKVRIIERDDEGGEVGFLAGLRKVIGRAEVVVYGATREFDEMILKGRFTNARRAHEPVPFYPALPGADYLSWRNVGNIHVRGIERSPEADWPNKVGYELSLVHNLRDVVALILIDGDPDPECWAWCERVMTDTEFARREILGGE
jgi:hypothetical protein